ncbi:hypothetical protein TMatcc_005334 [Talaromyces marneffei ATCC 18224]|uniref:chitinase n=2 Tax=Talaromyces marneffei TaxID=37727 RepID=B6QB89_TALMQ|nr:uncharacterized protein EYB26_006111 [Talaromyces marneffei]EEA26398.1 conserved hypothetical protein [Talaromyces marneffei ATCC 18224]KAE8555090.1 hypothetical protein EYB25_003638 [Talaromyces marneffei]QGA18426.1 hypothetical protein EYB26_006111 [Talaromyces marneffei]
MSYSVVSAAVWLLFFCHAVSGTFLSQIEPCPDYCGDKDPSDWTVYSSLAPLSQCNQPILFDFNIHNPVDANTIFKLRACNAGNAMPSSVAHVNEGQSNITSRSVGARATPSNSSSRSSGSTTNVSFQLLSGGSSASTAAKDYTTILSALQNRLKSQVANNTASTALFGYSNGVTVGMFIGAGMDPAATPQVFKYLLAQQPGSEIVAQLCGDNRTARHVYGMSVNTNGDISAIQKDVLSWWNAKCVESSSATASQTFNVDIVDQNLGKTNSSSVKARRDGTCRTVTVYSGDSCGSLASECGISGQDFTTYNSQRTNLCSTLAVGEKVCCSSGGLPNWQPSANPDGTCVVYNVQPGDNCAAIAANYGWQISDLSTFNDGTTWGWSGCALQTGLAMCVSKGTPPLPASVSNALCGPIVPGTTQPTDGTAIADLNPCPLNACCDIWGQCGITEPYCEDNRGPTGNPGTAPVNEYGCISNCGTGITNNRSPPSQFISVGYYEQFNWNRECLNMRSADLQGSSYTHIHWAFAGINPDFTVNITDDGDSQFTHFLQLTGVKRIISFGGWGYSTDPSTYDILRSAMTEANRDTFVNNIKNFAIQNNLDGIDIDWEYPGEPDIPGIPKGQPTDGPNYLQFLLALKVALGDKMSVSIAAPASYWYLKQFPIRQMSQVVDYIVYMTYDLHGQWDYGNKFSQEGCPNGNCLRSHVNFTETGYTLAMLTKAGVSSNKIIVGISSYGRSFGMTDPSCTGPDCTFQGQVVNGTGGGSTADFGRCTATRGYISNAEIDELVANGVAKGWYDSDSDSDMAVWGSTWVAYQSVFTRGSRSRFYKVLNFGGTIDWAVDLLEFTGDDGDETDPSQDTSGNGSYPLPDLSCSASYATLDAIAADAGKIPSMCAAIYMVQILQKMYNDAMAQYNSLMTQGYDDKFKTYAGVVVDHAGASMTQMIYGNGTKYFDCVVAEVNFCCSVCNSNDHGCDYCRNETSGCKQFCNPRYGVCSPIGKRGLDASAQDLGPTGIFARDVLPIPGFSKEPEPCPPDYSKHGYGGAQVNGVPSNSIWWNFRNDQTTAQFYADLYSETAIPKNKTSIQTHVRNNNACAPSSHQGDDCWNLGVDYTMPYVDNYTISDVVNPKDVVTQATANATDLLGQIGDVLSFMQSGLYEGDYMDVVDTISIPIMMINSSVTEMATIESVADEITKERRMEIIMAFFGAILFLIPIAGEVLGSIAELAEIGAIVSAVGEVGNVAFDIYSVASDPNNAPLAIMSAIFEPFALLDIAKVAKAAAIRRGMSADEVGKLGKQVKPVLDKIDTIKTGSKCNR